MTKNKPDYKKDAKTPSIWDEDVDMEKVNHMTPKERHRIFPNDYAPNGEPYGDF